MNFSIRKRIKIIPGIYLNFSNRGISTTIGPRGLSLYAEQGKSYLNVGIPRAGVSARVDLDAASNPYAPARAKEVADRLRYMLDKTYDDSEQIKSEPLEQLTSPGLHGLKETIIAAHKAHGEISREISALSARKSLTDQKLYRLQCSIFRFLYKQRIERYANESSRMGEELAELSQHRELATIDMQVSNDNSFAGLYAKVRRSYEVLISCAAIWDITASREIDRVRLRSAAGTEVNRATVKACIENWDVIVLEDTPLKLENKNGGNLYFFPGFVVIHEDAMSFAILDYAELDTEFSITRFIETDPVPADTEIAGYTWAKVNKDGSPDKRFSSNYQIPVVKYGEIGFTSSTGLREKYLFSNVQYACLFHQAFKEYLQAIKTVNSLIQEFTAPA